MCFLHTVAFPKFVTRKTVRTCPSLTKSPVSTLMNVLLVTYSFFSPCTLNTYKTLIPTWNPFSGNSDYIVPFHMRPVLFAWKGKGAFNHSDICVPGKIK